MKKTLLLIFFISSFIQAQYTINGTMSPTIKSDWVILYKIEGAKQRFIESTKIKIDTITTKGNKQTVGAFSFTLPKETKAGAYRVTYTLKGGYVDFLFNKEDIGFSFHPDYPDQSVNFIKSKENKTYNKYLVEISKAQKKLDSLQVTSLKDSTLNLKKQYKKALNKINSIQKKYLNASKGMSIVPFIKASLRNNPPEILTSTKSYMSNLVGTFFKNVDFNNKTLLNSSFLIDKITDYIFYINYSDDETKQRMLYKKSAKKVFSKIKDLPFKKDVIEFLVAQFETTMNIEMIDYLLSEYKKLPITLQKENYISKKIALTAAEVGRIAPDFSWKEGKKTLKLSKLKNAKNYILVFWSTTCSHCLKEMPELHKFTKGNTNLKVIAYSLESEKFGWENYKKNLYSWHNVLGLNSVNKWENKVARTYNIHATPSYFILDANKKIIAKPEELEDVKLYFKKK